MTTLLYLLAFVATALVLGWIFRARPDRNTAGLRAANRDPGKGARR